MGSGMEKTNERQAELLHKDLSYKVVGCAQKVHRVLGPGFPESIYQRALCHELLLCKIPFDSQKETDVYYEGLLCGQFRMDVLVEGKVILELKAVDAMTDDHVSQAISYLKATGLRLAILMNFGKSRLQTKRVVI